MKASGLNDQITYWAPVGDSRYGGLTYAAPILLPARWEDRQERIMKANGDEFISKTRIFLGQDVQVGGMIAHGDYTAMTDPQMGGMAVSVINGFVTMPNLRSITKDRRAYL